MARPQGQRPIKGNKFFNIGRWEASGCTGDGGEVVTGVTTRARSAYITFDANLFHDIGRVPQETYCGHDFRHDHGIYAKGRYIVIKNNIFYNMYAGWAIKVDGYVGDIGADESTHVIINNTFAPEVRTDRNGGGQIRFFNNGTFYSGYGNQKDPKNVIVQNNIFYQPGGPAADTAIRIAGAGGWPWSGTVIRNNMTTSPYLYDENLGSSVTSHVISSANAVSEDPPFVDPDKRDFHLKPDSPAIGAGHPEALPSHDFDGHARKSSLGADIGALSYPHSTSIPLPET